MPLTNNVIVKLNELSSIVDDKNSLKKGEILEIKNLFNKILESGESFNVDEIESWLENEGSWNNKQVRIRISNISNYLLTKFEDTKNLRIISKHDNSCCDS